MVMYPSTLLVTNHKKKKKLTSAELRKKRKERLLRKKFVTRFHSILNAFANMITGSVEKKFSLTRMIFKGFSVERKGKGLLLWLNIGELQVLSCL
jgi:hypothetical protein